ncbi:putative IMV surface protein [Parapoxvirus red deer/HL953]|uniref:Putative IMV surface protein n=1 Tax=Parapoxvirus red deer/HL953 TaxID=1579460 RepID=A0A0A7MEV3_9POXV|nr:putative IMV surface protein [Parapoxvirus red deer/HL953]AIZ77356.1 putative IMV surface protein [Parapoxvirus red deer/HL953]
MDAVSALCVALASAGAMFLIVQSWAVYENLDNIREFNEANAALELAFGTGGPRVDRRVYDPNDEVLDARKKWRCVTFKGAVVAASEFGFRSHDGISPARFGGVDACVDEIFTDAADFRVFNPCLPPNQSSEACKFLKSIL